MAAKTAAATTRDSATVAGAVMALAAPALREYQAAAVTHVIEACAGWRKGGGGRLYFSLPTGTGKAVILAALAERFVALGRVLLVVHREELVKQLAAQCLRVLPEPGAVGVVMADRDEIGARVIVASIQTLRKPRLARLLDATPGEEGAPATMRNVAALIIDECHHIAPGNTYARLIARVEAHAPGVAVIGCTATPFRADRDVMQDVLPRCVFERDIPTMQAAGWLAPVRWRPVVVPMHLADIVFAGGGAAGERDYQADALALEAKRPNVLRALAEGTAAQLGDRPAVAFGVDVEHAHLLAQAYRAAGIAAAAVWGEMPHADRMRTLDAWRRGDLQLVANCGILTEGFDFPAIAAIVMARPTQSLTLYMQMLGRGTRLAEGKTDCLIFDATPGKPDPRQVTLGDVMPIAEGGIGGGDEDGDDSTDETAPQRPRGRRSILSLRDPRHDNRYRWQFHAAYGIYTVAVGGGETLYLVRDPDPLAGSGLYRVALVSREEVTALAFKGGPVHPLRVWVRELRTWLDEQAGLALAGKHQLWHAQTATPKQLAFLARHVPADYGAAVRERWTSGQASAAIDTVIVGWSAARVQRSLWGYALASVPTPAPAS